MRECLSPKIKQAEGQAQRCAVPLKIRIPRQPQSGYTPLQYMADNFQGSHLHTSSSCEDVHWVPSCQLQTCIHCFLGSPAGMLCLLGSRLQTVWCMDYFRCSHCLNLS